MNLGWNQKRNSYFLNKNRQQITCDIAKAALEIAEINMHIETQCQKKKRKEKQSIKWQPF